MVKLVDRMLDLHKRLNAAKILSQPEGCSMTSPPAGNAQPMVRAEKLTADTCIEDRFGSDP